MPPHQAECLVAAGAEDFVSGEDIAAADDFLQEGKWAFGHLSYELQHKAHGISATKEEKIGFPLFNFFRPQIVLEINDDSVTVHAPDPERVWQSIHSYSLERQTTAHAVGPVKAAVSKEEYLQKIAALKEHIRRGDCYEINFCQEFTASPSHIDPYYSFEHLMAVSPTPFSAFYRLHDKYLLCASPERFLTKKEGRLFSQPIKGTAKRQHKSSEEDEALKQSLRQSQKDQSENVMVVDLVRNDLARVCREGSVRVDELFGVYTFPQVHQLISTVSGDLREDVPFSEMIAALFPMGSMTGAPKYRVMQLIQQYEPAARGIFSGSVGYFHPNGNFDFNVVIRSIMYNEAKSFLSYQVGSGITFYSDAEGEWDECMLKGDAIRQVLCAIK